MTTLEDAVAAPTVLHVGVWPCRRRVLVSPLRWCDVGFYLRNRTGGRWDSYLNAWLSLRQNHPKITYWTIWRWCRWPGFARRLHATIEALNPGAFEEPKKTDEGGTAKQKPVTGDNLLLCMAELGFGPEAVSRMTRAQTEIYTAAKEGGDGMPGPTKYKDMDDWRAQQRAAGLLPAEDATGAKT